MRADEPNSRICADVQKKSTGRGGPKTDAGKARSKRNATKHGIFSSAPVIEGESVGEYKSFRAAMTGELGPHGILEQCCAEKIVTLWWQLRRRDRAESAEIDKTRVFLLRDEVEGKIDAAREVWRNRLMKGLMNYASNSFVLDRCLDFLAELKSRIRAKGFEYDEDIAILDQLCGIVTNSNLYSTLRDTYQELYATSKLSKEERQRLRYLTPTQCKQEMVLGIEKEFARLKGLGESLAASRSERHELEYLSRSVLQGSDLNRFIRYGTSLEKSLIRHLKLLKDLQKGEA